MRRPRLRWRLALTQRLAGDLADAKLTAEQVRNTLEQLYKDQPDSSALRHCCLKLCRDGREGVGPEEAERAIMLLPRAKDAVIGPGFEENSGANSDDRRRE